MTVVMNDIKPSDVSEQSISLGFGPELEEKDYQTLAIYLLQYMIEWENNEFRAFELENFRLFVEPHLRPSIFAKIGEMVAAGYLAASDQGGAVMVIIDQPLIEFYAGHAGT